MRATWTPGGRGALLALSQQGCERVRAHGSTLTTKDVEGQDFAEEEKWGDTCVGFSPCVADEPRTGESPVADFLRPPPSLQEVLGCDVTCIKGGSKLSACAGGRKPVLAFGAEAGGGFRMMPRVLNRTAVFYLGRHVSERSPDETDVNSYLIFHFGAGVATEAPEHPSGMLGGFPRGSRPRLPQGKQCLPTKLGVMMMECL